MFCLVTINLFESESQTGALHSKYPRMALWGYTSIPTEWAPATLYYNFKHNFGLIKDRGIPDITQESWLEEYLFPVQ